MTPTLIGPAQTPASCFLTPPSLRTLENQSVVLWTKAAHVLLLTSMYISKSEQLIWLHLFPLTMLHIFHVLASCSSCCPSSLREPGMGRPPLRAQDFMANNPEHLELLRRMGVSLIHLKDGRVQLVQHASQVNILETHLNKHTQTHKVPP